MKTRSPGRPVDVSTLALMARLLERLDRSAEPVDAGQYRAVAQRVSALLAATPPSEALKAVLDACPSAAELYENLNYRHAGLCRSPLDEALGAESKALSAIRRALRSV
jgi:hypothetical protein